MGHPPLWIKVPVWTAANMTSNEEDLKEPTGWGTVGREDLILCVLPGLAVMLIVAYFADLGRGRAAGLCALVDILVMRLRWTFKGRIGFWFAISLILLAQTALIARVPFGNQWMSTYALLPIALVVYLVDECIVFLLTRRFGTRSK
jgi:hypothetical protein